MSTLSLRHDQLPSFFDSTREIGPRVTGHSSISRIDGLPIVKPVGIDNTPPLAIFPDNLANEIDHLNVSGGEIPPAFAIRRIIKRNGFSVTEDKDGSNDSFIDAIASRLIDPNDHTQWAILNSKGNVEIGPDMESPDIGGALLSKSRDSNGMRLNFSMKTEFIPDTPDTIDPLIEEFTDTDAEVAVTLTPSEPDVRVKAVTNRGTGAFIKGMIESLFLRIGEKLSPQTVAGLAMGAIAVKLALNSNRKK